MNISTRSFESVENFELCRGAVNQAAFISIVTACDLFRHHVMDHDGLDATQLIQSLLVLSYFALFSVVIRGKMLRYGLVPRAIGSELCCVTALAQDNWKHMLSSSTLSA